MNRKSIHWTQKASKCITSFCLKCKDDKKVFLSMKKLQKTKCRIYIFYKILLINHNLNKSEEINTKI